MNEQEKIRESVNTTISGGVSGQVAVGHHIAQTQAIGVTRPELTQEDLAQLHQILADLKAQVAAEAPADTKDAAIERIDELETAVTAKEPDLSTMEYVRNWFGKNAPKLAGAVTSVVIHPIVGKAVEAAGDLVSAEFRRRFGGDLGNATS